MAGRTSVLDLQSYLADNKRRVDETLESLLPVPIGPAATVLEAMRYAVTAGGWEASADTLKLMDKLSQAGYGWFVLVSGREITTPEPPEGGER